MPVQQEGLPTPVEEYSDDLYHFNWPVQGISLEMERFTEKGGDIQCEMSVESLDPIAGGMLVNHARLLLLGPNSRRDMRKMLEERDATIDWGAALEQACGLALLRYREGEPVLDLFSVAFTQSSRFCLSPLVISNAVTIWYGDGSAAKSMMAMIACALVAYNLTHAGLVPGEQGKALYLDWEDDAETHAERLRAICEGLHLDPAVATGLILYQRMTTSLHEAVRDVRKRVVQNGVRLVIVDSVGMAGGDDPNEASTIIKCLSAARQLGCSVIAIHHLPKDTKDKTKPIGSVYAANEARATWLFEKTQEDGSDELRLALTNFKSNRSQLHPRQAFGLKFVTDPTSGVLISVTIRKLSFTQGSSIGQALGASASGRKWKVMAALRDYGPSTASQIGERLHMTEANARATLNANREMFRSVGQSGREAIWELLPSQADQYSASLVPDVVVPDFTQSAFPDEEGEGELVVDDLPF